MKLPANEVGRVHVPKHLDNLGLNPEERAGAYRVERREDADFVEVLILTEQVGSGVHVVPGRRWPLASEFYGSSQRDRG